MKSKLSTDILQKGEASLFQRTGRAQFALREWDKHEYVADRYKKALFDEDIVVFPGQLLPELMPEHGLYAGPLDTQRLYDNLRAMRRRDAEEDVSVIQLVAAFVLRYHGHFLTYKRAKRLPEARLHDVYSLAFGGHLNPDDVSPLFDIFIPGQSYPWLERELREEVHLPRGKPRTIEYVGVIYDTSRPVSKQHLGIVYQVKLDSPVFSIGERGFLIDAKFESELEIEARLADFENWSTLLFDTLRSNQKP
jgi:predicted NUDIX family phosphoesterase